MTDSHPDELELFSFVEGDLAEDRIPAVSEHVERCSRCAAKVRDLEASKAALRRAPLVGLQPRRRDAIFDRPPRREPWRSPFASPKRLLVVLTAIAAVVAVVAVLTTTGGKTGGGVRAVAPVATVAGPPGRVAELLRRRGFDARALVGSVEVRGADASTLARALAGLGPGRVPVYVK